MSGATRNQSAEAFKHVLEEVLHLPENSIMHQALAQNDYDDMVDLVTLAEEDIDGMEYPVSTADTISMESLPTKYKKLLTHVVWFSNERMVARNNVPLRADDWLKVTAAEFTYFCMQTVPLLNKGVNVIPSANIGASVVTQSDVSDFNKGIKKDARKYKTFNGSYKDWFHCKRNWRTEAASDGIKHLLEAQYMIPSPGTQAYNLYEAQNTYLYNVFNRNITGQQGQIIVRNHESSLDGRQVY